MVLQRSAKFGLGQVVRHLGQDARGVILDADARDALADTLGATLASGWTVSPSLTAGMEEQPFYRVLFQGYVAYMPEGELEADDTGGPLQVDALSTHFKAFHDGRYQPRGLVFH
ncbi:MAG TPA: hemimethylated DNA-binding YccV-like domain-containing protein [Caulobacteraceae bacterium]